MAPKHPSCNFCIDPLGTEDCSTSPGEMVPFSAETCKGEAIAGAEGTNSHSSIPSTDKKKGQQLINESVTPALKSCTCIALHVRCFCTHFSDFSIIKCHKEVSGLVGPEEQFKVGKSPSSDSCFLNEWFMNPI